QWNEFCIISQTGNDTGKSTFDFCKFVDWKSLLFSNDFPKRHGVILFVVIEIYKTLVDALCEALSVQALNSRLCSDVIDLWRRPKTISEACLTCLYPGDLHN